MTASTKFHGLHGSYFLTAKGQLGFFDAKGQLLLDKQLTEAFSEHSQTIVSNFQKDTEQDGLSLGILYPPDNEHEWHFETMLLDETVLRELYPSGGQKNAELTSFQKRNQEKSLYRGIELLLDYRKEINAEAIVYCPVLINRKTSLADYPEARLGRETRSDDVHTPVLEVINFLAPILLSRRVTEEIKILHKSIYDGVVKKELRDDDDLTILQGVHKRIGHDDNDSIKAYQDHDQRDDRRVSISGDSNTGLYGRSSQDAGLDQAGRRTKPGRLIKTHGKYAHPDELRRFEQFRDLSMDQLSEIAVNYPIVTVPSGTTLLKRNSNDDKNLYLLDGAVELEAEDSDIVSIRSDSEKATKPIASLKPRKYDVTSVTEIRFLWIGEAFLEELVHGNNAPSYGIKS